MGPGEFGRLLHDFLEASLELAPQEESELARRLRDHLGREELATLPVLKRDLELRDHPNLQIALDQLRDGDGWTVESIGVAAAYGKMMGRAGLHLEVVALEPEHGEDLMARVTELMNEHNVYRGRVLAFARTDEGGVSVQIRALPEVERDSIILPDGVLERIERHALGVARHRERLLAAGRHLKRGLLLHGPPGTGKTTTAMYLVARMPGRTVLLLTGDALGLIEPACALARELEPAMVVLEDVDLVAHDRMYDESGPVLFELLNEMDGLASDADVLFLLTTNRPDILEPALAARPGRIDQAVELPLPDAADLRRLLDLYGTGLEMRVDDLDGIVDRLAGATPAHVKELLRKAALIAAEESDGAIVVEDRHLHEALEDLATDIARIKQRLFAADEPGEDDFPFPAEEEIDAGPY